jgi:hypothetical protein
MNQRSIAQIESVEIEQIEREVHEPIRLALCERIL